MTPSLGVGFVKLVKIISCRSTDFNVGESYGRGRTDNIIASLK